jgi:hypothetical protein
MNSSSQSTFGCPTAFETAIQGPPRHSKLVGPVACALCYSIEVQQPGASCVSHLHRLSSPLAVVLRVADRIVNSLNGVRRRWSRAHVSIERLKRVPRIADRYTTPAVVIVAGIRNTLAARVHCPPHRKFWRCAHSVSFLSTMNTASTSAPTQGASINRCHRSAITDTVPIHMSIAYQCFVGDGPLTNSLASQIFWLAPTCDRIHFSHDGTPNTGLVRTARQHQLLGRSYCSTHGTGELAT